MQSGHLAHAPVLRQAASYRATHETDAAHRSDADVLAE
jgi:hypothetical protein